MPKKKEIKTKFAKDSLIGKIWSAENAEKKDVDGEIIKYFCTCCNEELTLKKGEVKIHHFAHKSNSYCHKNPEISTQTSLHYKAKDLFEERTEKFIEIPGIKPFFKSFKFEYEKVLIEKKCGHIIPDILLIDKDNNKLAVEITVSHGINNDKFQKYCDLGINCLEINIESLKDEDYDEDFLKKILFENTEDLEISKELKIPNLNYLKNNLKPYSSYNSDEGISFQTIVNYYNNKFQYKHIYNDGKTFLFSQKKEVEEYFIEIQKKLDKKIKSLEEEFDSIEFLGRKIYFKNFKIRNKDIDYRAKVLEKINKSSEGYISEIIEYNYLLNYKIISELPEICQNPDNNFWKEELNKPTKIFFRKIPNQSIYSIIINKYFNLNNMLNNNLLDGEIWNSISSFIQSINRIFGLSNIINLNNLYENDVLNLLKLFLNHRCKEDYSEIISKKFLKAYKEDHLFYYFFSNKNKFNKKFIKEINTNENFLEEFLNSELKTFVEDDFIKICNESSYFRNYLNKNELLKKEIRMKAEEIFLNNVHQKFKEDFYEYYRKLFKNIGPNSFLNFEELLDNSLDDFLTKNSYELTKEELKDFIKNEEKFLGILKEWKIKKETKWNPEIKKVILEKILDFNISELFDDLENTENPSTIWKKLYDSSSVKTEISLKNMQKIILNTPELKKIIEQRQFAKKSKAINKHKTNIIETLKNSISHEVINECLNSEEELETLEKKLKDILKNIKVKDVETNFLLKNEILNLENSIFDDFKNETRKIIKDAKILDLEIKDILKENKPESKPNALKKVKHFYNNNSKYPGIYFKTQIFLEEFIENY